MSKDKVIVNSWNEWDPLKHVIVGTDFKFGRNREGNIELLKKYE